MKQVLLAGMIAAFAAGSAMAADMPLKAPPAPVMAPTWTGTYLGINGGYAWSRSSLRNDGPGGTTSGDFDLKGGLAGVTYGGNWQTGHVVLGFESDFDWAHINGNTGAIAICGGVAPGCETDTKWFSTERMRAGWDFNGWLLYGTGGAAFADVKSFIGTCGPGSCGEKTRVGWTAGVGLETMFWHNWSAKIEYLHYDLGRDVMFNAGPGVPISSTERGDMVRAGINYHFDLLNLLHF